MLSPDPTVDEEVNVVKSDLVNSQTHLKNFHWIKPFSCFTCLVPTTPDNAGLEEFEDVEEKGEEDDGENVDEEPLLEARIVELQSPGYRDPTIEFII